MENDYQFRAVLCATCRSLLRQMHRQMHRRTRRWLTINNGVIGAKCEQEILAVKVPPRLHRFSENRRSRLRGCDAASCHFAAALCRGTASRTGVQWKTMQLCSANCSARASLLMEHDYNQYVTCGLCFLIEPDKRLFAGSSSCIVTECNDDWKLTALSGTIQQILVPIYSMYICCINNQNGTRTVQIVVLSTKGR